MPLYEHVLLGRQELSTVQVDTLVEELKTIIEAGGGKIIKNEYWGIKPISYKIKKNRKAHYTLLNIDATPDAVAEMERQMSISTDVLRFMTIRVDEHEEGPSAMMRKSDRDERRPRGRDGGGRDFSRDNNRDGGGRDFGRDSR